MQGKSVDMGLPFRGKEPELGVVSPPRNTNALPV